MLGEFADADKIAQVKAQMGLDTPLPVQYFNWLKDLLHGDMGTSYFQKKPVITLILQAFHYTVIMATGSVHCSADRGADHRHSGGCLS